MSDFTLNTRGRWKFSLADIKKIFCRSDLWSKNISCVSCAAWNVFPINLLVTSCSTIINACLLDKNKMFAKKKEKKVHPAWPSPTLSPLETFLTLMDSKLLADWYCAELVGKKNLQVCTKLSNCIPFLQVFFRMLVHYSCHNNFIF